MRIIICLMRWSLKKRLHKIKRRKNEVIGYKLNISVKCINICLLVFSKHCWTTVLYVVHTKCLQEELNQPSGFAQYWFQEEAVSSLHPGIWNNPEKLSKLNSCKLHFRKSVRERQISSPRVTVTKQLLSIAHNA